MPSAQTLEAFIARVEANRHAEAIEEFYTVDAAMQENDSAPRKGRDALAANERKVLARMRSVRSRCVRPVLANGDHVVIRWVFDFEKLDGTRLRIEELAYQRWQGEKIAEEKFFYDPVQLGSRAIELDHFIVPCRDQVASAKRLAEILGVRWVEKSAAGPFSPVFVNDGLTLDFIQTQDAFPVHHYCFRVAQAQFDAVLARIREAGIPYRSSVRGPTDMKVDATYGNFYWNEPDGHMWELLTVSYARA